ncbi:MAG: ATP synthase F1 subunit epsilon [Rhodospirillales bacterium]|nr:ATP synthase F1 subunit epsilon [Rhodospirillales bacterium]
MEETIRFEIVTPAKLMLSEEVPLVVLPGEQGHFGVLPRHAPLLSSLRPGTIEIYDGKMKITQQIFVETGFVEVTPERCTVLAEEAIPVQEITRDFAEERLKRASDALMVADTFGVRVGAERELRAAEAMCEAVDMMEKSRG